MPTRGSGAGRRRRWRSGSRAATRSASTTYRRCSARTMGLSPLNTRKRRTIARPADSQPRPRVPPDRHKCREVGVPIVACRIPLGASCDEHWHNGCSRPSPDMMDARTTTATLTLSRRAEPRLQTGIANPSTESFWALVLAGGDGTRLQGVTRMIAGAPIPKQYCRILGSRLLLEATLRRIAPLVQRGPPDLLGWHRQRRRRPAQGGK
jgi:hypothetical protein